MELIKNIFKYLIILIVVFILACGLIAGILFIFPKAKIFGFQYASSHDKNVVLFADETVNKVNITTANYDIKIVPNSQQGLEENKNLRIVVENDYTGFSNNGTAITRIKNAFSENEETISVNKIDLAENYSFYRKDGEFTLDIVEPKGVMSYGSSRIVIYLPENAENVKFNLTTEKGAISFAKSEVNSSRTISASNIKIIVKNLRGSFNLDNAQMKEESDLTISNFLGIANINSEEISNVVIDSDQGSFNFKNINGNLTITGNNPYVRVDAVSGNLKFETTTGFIEVGELKKGGIITTKNGIVRIDKVLGGLELNNESGEITIGQTGDGSTDASVNIYGKSGAITLGKNEETDVKSIYNLNSVVTETGKIVIKNLVETNVEKIETTKGSISIEFALDNEVKNINLVKTVKGKIEVKNICGKVNCESNTGEIYAEFLRYTDESSFKTTSSKIELTLSSPTSDANRQFTLELKNKENKLKINIGAYPETTSFSGEKDVDGYYRFIETFPQDSTTLNKISVTTTSGMIVLKEKVKHNKII